jgi:hypothetical protein
MLGTSPTRVLQRTPLGRGHEIFSPQVAFAASIDAALTFRQRYGNFGGWFRGGEANGVGLGPKRCLILFVKYRPS